MEVSANSSPHPIPGTLSSSSPPEYTPSLIFCLKSCFAESDFKNVERAISSGMENLRKGKEEMEAKYRSALEKCGQMEVESLARESKILMMTEKFDKLKEQKTLLEHELYVSKRETEAANEELKAHVEESEKNRREMVGKNQDLEKEKSDLEMELEKLGKDNLVLKMEKGKIEDEWKTKLKEKEEELVELVRKKRELEDELTTRLSKIEEKLPLYLRDKEGDPGTNAFCSDGPVNKNGAMQGVGTHLSDVVIRDEQNTSLEFGRISKERSSTPKEPRRWPLDYDIKDSSGQGAARVPKPEPVKSFQTGGPVEFVPNLGSVEVVDISDSDDDDAPLAVGHKRKQPIEIMYEKVIGSGSDDNDADKYIGKRRRKELKELPCEPSEDHSPCHQPIDCHDSLDDSDDETSKQSQSAQKLIASVRRSREENLWEYKEDMVYAFKKDVELCMKGVCALYRRLKSVGERKFHLLLSGDTDQNERDIKRIIALAEFLIDGDPDDKMKKLACDLQQQGLQDCKRLAVDYSGRLFNIYKNQEDPLFCRGVL